MSKILIIGGGAAGMLASIAAAEEKNEVHVLEQNEKLGKKLFITGKGRCNITNDCDMETLFENVISNPKFLYSAFYSFTNQDMMKKLEEWGLPLKTERGGRVFPISDKSSDVIDILQKKMQKAGVHIHLKTQVERILIEEEEFRGVRLTNKEMIKGDKLIIATGGNSYPATGSTGDGYRFAREMGHQITELSPALVPMNGKEEWIKELQGLSLKNVAISLKSGKKELYQGFGEMLFTHFGVSGPLILSASSYVGKALKKGEITLDIDLKAALSREQVEDRLLREFEENKNKRWKNVIGNLLPAKLVPVMLEYIGVEEEKRTNEITKEERKRIVDCLKEFTITITGLRGFREAIITRGGVSVKEINPSTMESKLIKGVYFAGEVLDLDALTGGFNLQIAWSTGYLAGKCVKG